jgi:hypothetical protein
MIEPDPTQTTANADDGEPPEDHPSGVVQLLPLLTFGLRAAALAGVAVSLGTAALGAATDTTPDITASTCCIAGS